MRSYLRSFRAALGLLCAAPLLPDTAAAQGLRPGGLLVYYGYPSAINAAPSVPAAATEFGAYDYVVWGEGLENPAHPDHANAVAIMADGATGTTRIFGYVDVGVITQDLPMTEIEARVAGWRQMGADGVLFDSFGYDFQTGRTRQNAAVDLAHAQGLVVIVSAFRPADAFGNDIDPIYNPSGLAARLGASDFYLYESHGVRLGEYEDGVAWRQRSDELETYRQALGFRVLSITTTVTDGPGAYDEARFFYAWHAAALYGHTATGWGEFEYSASGASSSQAPFRTRPALDPGTSFTGPVFHAGTLHTRGTDNGRIWLDTGNHTFGFWPGSTDVPAIGADATGLSMTPNPVRTGGRATFALERPAGVRVALFDVVGRKVATLVEGEFAAGRHEQPWSGYDHDGRRVAPGAYFLVLDSAGRRSRTRVVVTR